MIIGFSYLSFNPRTHEGCDRIDRQAVMGASVSIHAPTRGATVRSRPKPHCICVSIHAPTRGATQNRIVSTDGIRCFNPRTHEGCDASLVASASRLIVSIHAPTRGATASLLHTSYCLPVSIHAPTRGATSLQVRRLTPYGCFNPRTHEGCDVVPWVSHAAQCLFQSTHPRGVRLTFYWICGQLTSFNPRTHEGCDTISFKRLVSSSEFQSTHPRGVRLLAHCIFPALR